MMSQSEVYRYPQYYAIGYRWNTEAECRFIEECLKAHGPPSGRRLLDIGCGAGRHLRFLAGHGFQVTGIDIQPEMVAFVNALAKTSKLPITAQVDDLRHLTLTGSYDVAFCFMDTFRFLLTNDEIIDHLKRVARLLSPGGLYLTDFWIPSQWDQIGSEIHQWEQTEGQTQVRVFYVQHPDSIDPIAQTFEDELVFEVHEGDQVKEIRGGRTTTRLIMPQEFRLFVEASGVFDLVGTFRDFDLTPSVGAASSSSWRMISLLKRRSH